MCPFAPEDGVEAIPGMIGSRVVVWSSFQRHRILLPVNKHFFDRGSQMRVWDTVDFRMISGWVYCFDDISITVHPDLRTVLLHSLGLLLEDLGYEKKGLFSYILQYTVVRFMSCCTVCYQMQEKAELALNPQSVCQTEKLRNVDTESCKCGGSRDAKV